MQEITFQIYHPKLNVWSDQTFRAIFKKLSSLLREVQFQEVIYLIQSSDIPASEKQSLTDKLLGPLNHIDAYYVEKVERGSLSITVCLTEIGLWLLQNTIGESIKDAWRQVETHKKIVDYLSKPSQREPVIDRNVDRVMDAWSFSGFQIDKIEKTVDETAINYRISLKTEIELQNHIDHNYKKMTSVTVVAEGLKEIERLELKLKIDNF